MEQQNNIVRVRGSIVNFRIGSRGRNPRWRQVILRLNLPEGLNRDMLLGKTVVVKWRNKIFRGKIYRKHGKCCVRALFKKALPGQILLGGYQLEVLLSRKD